jgi:tRNA(fMet)-specific endonuclease VapC
MAMRAILIDTNAYAAFKNGVAEAVRIISHAPLIGISTIVLGELRSGFAFGSREAVNLQELAEFLASKRVRIIPLDQETARCYADVYRGLRQKGKPIPTNDMWIAASALQHGLAVFSYDGHFGNVDQLITGNLLEQFLS